MENIQLSETHFIALAKQLKGSNPQVALDTLKTYLGDSAPLTRAFEQKLDTDVTIPSGNNWIAKAHGSARGRFLEHLQSRPLGLHSSRKLSSVRHATRRIAVRNTRRFVVGE